MNDFGSFYSMQACSAKNSKQKSKMVHFWNILNVGISISYKLIFGGKISMDLVLLYNILTLKDKFMIKKGILTTL